MRSLAFKLTLVFLIVGLTGAVLVALFVAISTRRQFDRFVVDRFQNTLVTNLSEYYKTTGSWDGVDALFSYNVPIKRPESREQPLPLVLLDADSRVVFSGVRHIVGGQIPQRDHNSGIPIEVDGQVVGWLVADGESSKNNFPFGAGGILRQNGNSFVDEFWFPDSPTPGTPEAAFLSRMSWSITYGALGATVIALLVGAVLVRTLTQPIRELTAATRAMAKGALEQQVAVRSQDELGELALAFNQMSADLARANRQRRQMTADIAHDLRTPLSIILGYTEALSDGKFQGAPDIYAIMHDEARHLSHLIEDLRTLSLADAGELPLARQRVPPRELLERTALAHRAQAQEQGLSLEVEAGPDLAAVEVDPDRMAQVLGNLVSNALRYTPAGGRIVLAAGATAGGVTLRVQDNGAGIAPADLPHVFERFYRGDKSRHQNNGQTGLGLPIAKSLVEMHGGAIMAESVPGQGAIFTISLPSA